MCFMFGFDIIFIRVSLLLQSPYPRQSDIQSPSSSVVNEQSERPVTATNPNYNPSQDPLLQCVMPELPPSAPPLPPLPVEDPPRYDYIQRDQHQFTRH